jgi:hypothetical protein
VSDQADNVVRMEEAAEPAPDTVRQPAFARMMQMLSGYQITRALRFAVDLDLATILLDEPCTIDDLTVFTGAEHGTLERNVRLLESVGIFRTDGPNVEVTEFGASLAQDGGLLARDLVQQWLDSNLDSLRSVIGSSGGEGAVDDGRVGDVAVGDVPVGNVPVGNVTVAAGGNPLVGAGDDGKDTPPDHRIVPAGLEPTECIPVGEALVISSVLNSWTGEELARILDSLSVATPPGGRVVLIEMVLPADGATPRIGDTDPLMVSQLGGRGHTAAEWESVLASSGFDLERIRPGVPPFSFIEATRR